MGWFACASALVALGAAAQSPEANSPPAADWVVVGSFTGVPATGVDDLIGNEVFQEGRTGDLFQELGDLEAEVGYDQGGVGLDLRTSFGRRVVADHAVRPPGATLDADDVSGFREIDRALGQTVLSIDYVSDLPGPASLGFEAASGFVLAVARAHETPREELLTGEAAERELQALGASWPRRVLRKTGQGLVEAIDRLATAVGRPFEDTRKGEVFLEDFTAPLTLWADFGFPLPVRAFEEVDERFRPGDAVTYSAFLSVEPVKAGLEGWGMRASTATFYRFVRTTTVVKLAGNQVLVEVKDLAARGVETVPLKIRPELRLWVLRYGYTFLDNRHARSRFRIRERTFRLDLGTEGGRAELEEILQHTGRRRRPETADSHPVAGVEALAAEQRTGTRRDLKWRARMPSWFNTRRDDLQVHQTLTGPQGERVEASRGRVFFLRRRLFGRAERSAGTLVTFVTPWRQGELAGTEVEEDSRLRLQTAVKDRYTSRARRRELFGLLGEVAARAPAAELRRLEEPGREQLGLALALRLDLGPTAAEALARVSDEQLWQAAAERLLGPGYEAAWNADQRPLWRAGLRSPRGGRSPAARYDRELRRRDPERARAQPSARHLFHQAESFVAGVAQLRQELARGVPAGRPTWVPPSDPPLDFALLVSALRAAYGSLDRPGLRYQADLWTESMLRPVRWTGGRLSLPAEPEADGTTSDLYQTSASAPPATGAPLDVVPTAGDELGEVPDLTRTRDAPSRLAAGQVLAELAGFPAPARLRLDLYSDYLFAPGTVLAVDLRRSRIRRDLPEKTVRLAFPAPQPEPPGPFAVARFRYQFDLPFTIADPKEPRALYLRAIAANGKALSEEQPLRFRVSQADDARQNPPGQ